MPDFYVSLERAISQFAKAKTTGRGAPSATEHSNGQVRPLAEPMIGPGAIRKGAAGECAPSA
jgi:hypothetical protein